MMFIGVTLVSYLPMPYLLVRSDAVQHILQTVELVMVKHPDGIDGYHLRGNPAVCNIVLAHRAVTVSMD